jgi:hypothetical protein
MSHATKGRPFDPPSLPQRKLLRTHSIISFEKGRVNSFLNHHQIFMFYLPATSSLEISLGKNGFNFVSIVLEMSYMKCYIE